MKSQCGFPLNLFSEFILKGGIFDVSGILFPTELWMPEVLMSLSKQSEFPIMILNHLRNDSESMCCVSIFPFIYKKAHINEI